MSTEQPDAGPLNSLRGTGLRNMLLIWCIALVLAYAVYHFSGGQPETGRSRAGSGSPGSETVTLDDGAGEPLADKQLASLKAQLDQLSGQVERVSARAASERAVTKARQAELRADVRTIRQQLTRLKTLHAEWQAQAASLLTNEAGRRVAASPAHLELVFGVMDGVEDVTEKISLWEQQLMELATPLERATEDESISMEISPEYLDLLTELKRSVSLRVSDVERRKIQLAAILRETAQTAPGPARLEEALATYRLTQVRLEQERHQQALAEERAKTAELIRAAEVEKERMLREATEAAIRANAEVERKKIEDAIALVRQEEEKRQAEFQARLEKEQAEARYKRAFSEIRRHLVPFTSPGNRQLARNEWTYTEEKKPLSLAAIRAYGALDNSPEGHSKFYHIASGSNNDRPNGIFRGGYFGGHIRPELVPDVVKAQNLLHEFGDLLVEKGMLEP